MPDAQIRWERIQSLYEQASGLPPDQLEAFLERLEKEDEDVKEEVESLIQAEAKSGFSLDESPMLAMVPSRDDDFSLGHSALPPGDAPPEDFLPGYRITGEIHRGGQGVVYRAVQLSTKRDVAIKFMLASPFAKEETKRRFEREVEVIGRMKHPGIVPVFDSGLANDQYYYVMDFISGTRLDEYVRGKQLTPKSTLGLVAKICDAVNHAHQNGVIHRDLKPSNILVDDNGNPHVLDFGLAKLRDRAREETISMTGQIMGTLAYMSPEQAAGRIDAIGTRSDVYSLGVVLYELLTSELPYDVASSIGGGLSAIQDQPPDQKHLRTSRVGDEISTIIRKALSKDPDRRYPIAGMLGDDLRRYLRGEPIEAKRDSTLYVFGKTLRRHWVAAVVSWTFIVMLVSSSIVSTALYLAADKAQDDANRSARTFEYQRDEISALRDERVAQLYVAEMNLAGEALGEFGGLGRVREITNHWLNDDSARSLRGWEWFYLRSRLDRESFIWKHVEEVWCVQWDPAENRVAFGDFYGDVWIWEPGEEATKLGSVGKLVRSVAWSANGKKLAAGSTRGGIKVWDVKEREVIAEFPDFPDVLDLAWRPYHPAQLAVASGSGPVAVMDTRKEQEVASFDLQTGTQTVEWNRRGSQLLVSCHDNHFRLLDVDEKTTKLVSEPLDASVFSASRQPQGKRIAATSTNGMIALTSPTKEKSVWTHALGRPVWRLDWNNEGTRFATIGADRTLRIWRVQEDPLQVDFIDQLEGHAGAAWGLDWNHDSSLIATSGRDRTVRVWSTADGKRDRLYRPHGKLARRTIESIAWAPRGNRLAFGTANGQINIWDLESDQIESATVHNAVPNCLQWSHDGTRLVSGSIDETAVVWDVENRRVLANFNGHRGIEVDAFANAVQAARWSADDQWVASLAHDGTVVVWDPDTGETIAEHKDVPIPFDLAWHPEEESLVYIGRKSYDVKRWNVVSDAPPTVLHTSPSPIRGLAYSPDQTQIAAAREDGWIDLIDARTGELQFTLTDHVDTVHDVMFSPDSKRLASASSDGTVRIWDPKRGVQTLVLRARLKVVMTVAWGPQGRQLAYAGTEGTVMVVNAGELSVEQPE